MATQFTRELFAKRILSCDERDFDLGIASLDLQLHGFCLSNGLSVNRQNLFIKWAVILTTTKPILHKHRYQHPVGFKDHFGNCDWMRYVVYLLKKILMLLKIGKQISYINVHLWKNRTDEAISRAGIETQT